jgi:hypothetical protein
MTGISSSQKYRQAINNGRYSTCKYCSPIKIRHFSGFFSVIFLAQGTTSKFHMLAEGDLFKIRTVHGHQIASRQPVSYASPMPAASLFITT